jgi:hypothetical protein
MEELSGTREKKRNNERENKKTLMSESLNSINVPLNLTTEILLFGSPKLAPNQNVELFLAVQKFVICSKRFTH